MEFTLTDLAPFTWYKLYVQAVSRRFLGEPSQMIKYRTDVSSPMPPVGVNVTCYTQQDALLVQWKRPEKYFNSLDFYYVQYKSDSMFQFEERPLVAKKERPNIELLIGNLTAGLAYEIKIVAGSKSIYQQDLVYKSEQSDTIRVILQDNCECKYQIVHLCLIRSRPSADIYPQRTRTVSWSSLSF